MSRKDGQGDLSGPRAHPAPHRRPPRRLPRVRRRPARRPPGVRADAGLHRDGEGRLHHCQDAPAHGTARLHHRRVENPQPLRGDGLRPHEPGRALRVRHAGHAGVRRGRPGRGSYTGAPCLKIFSAMSKI